MTDRQWTYTNFTGHIDTVDGLGALINVLHRRTDKNTGNFDSTNYCGRIITLQKQTVAWAEETELWLSITCFSLAECGRRGSPQFRVTTPQPNTGTRGTIHRHENSCQWTINSETTC